MNAAVNGIKAWHLRDSILQANWLRVFQIGLNYCGV